MSEWSQGRSSGIVPRRRAGAPRRSPAIAALQIEEPLIFEQDPPGRCGVDLPEPPPVKHRASTGCDRSGADRPAGPQRAAGGAPLHAAVARRTTPSTAGVYPLGSCTMKHNPRLNEKMARLPGFADLHPLQPVSTVQGALELIDTLAHWLKTLTGMPAVALSPAAGAHGELCGMMAIRAALEARGERAHAASLVPESAHGTNPATAAALRLSRSSRSRPTSAAGSISPRSKAKLGPDVAAIMLTNPNTCGLFEREIIEIAEAVHEAGAFFYCDGANFNAIVGRVRPGDLGIDGMHINLHKTFSTPHGGGGPGAGPVVLSAALAPYAPLPWIVHGRRRVRAGRGRRRGRAAQPLGRLKAFHGQMGMFVRALAYMMSHGADGLRQVAEDAVLNANYLHGRAAGRDERRPSTAPACTRRCSTTASSRTPASPRSISPRR